MAGGREGGVVELSGGGWLLARVGAARVPGAVTVLFLLPGLGHPSLHQGMTPGFPPAMGGALPSAYQFARDPQSGQLVVIPSEHLPHFGESRGGEEALEVAGWERAYPWGPAAAALGWV